MRAAGPGAGVPSRSKVTADQVVLAAGTLGTQMILHTMKDAGILPGISERLGQLTRTNSESILTVEARDLEVDYSVGPAITSSIHPNDRTHVEPVRYGRGSNLMGNLSTVLTAGDRPGEPSVPRRKRFVAAVRSDPRSFLRCLSVRRWSQRTTVMLVMQSLDNSLNVTMEARPLRASARSPRRRAPASRTRRGSPRRMTRHQVRREDRRRGAWHSTETINIPMTAHILGGAPIGDAPQNGVIDPWQRVYGHDGIHVVDGSAVSANLGVEPVADHHCPGRARDLVLAQQGRV